MSYLVHTRLRLRVRLTRTDARGVEANPMSLISAAYHLSYEIMTFNAPC